MENKIPVINDSFGFVNNTFINIYSAENPLLNVDDECYFLFSNIADYHKVLVGKGIIKYDTINDGLTKTYYINLLEVIEMPDILDNFVYGKQFALTKFEKNIPTGNKLQYIHKETATLFFELNLFKIDGFFVRKNIENIIQLKKDYTKIIISDLRKQLTDIENDIF